jgi:hypothetical protein
MEQAELQSMKTVKRSPTVSIGSKEWNESESRRERKKERTSKGIARWKRKLRDEPEGGKKEKGPEGRRCGEVAALIQRLQSAHREMPNYTLAEIIQERRRRGGLWSMLCLAGSCFVGWPRRGDAVTRLITGNG